MSDRHLDPPEHDCPPDTLVRKVTITATMGDDGIWTIACPEWKCELHGKSLTKPTAQILANIDDHNDEIMQGEPDWMDNPKKRTEWKCGRDWDAIQARKRDNYRKTMKGTKP